MDEEDFRYDEEDFRHCPKCGLDLRRNGMVQVDRVRMTTPIEWDTSAGVWRYNEEGNVNRYDAELQGVFCRMCGVMVMPPLGSVYPPYSEHATKSGIPDQESAPRYRGGNVSPVD